MLLQPSFHDFQCLETQTSVDASTVVVVVVSGVVVTMTGVVEWTIVGVVVTMIGVVDAWTTVEVSGVTPVVVVSGATPVVVVIPPFPTASNASASLFDSSIWSIFESTEICLRLICFWIAMLLAMMRAASLVVLTCTCVDCGCTLFVSFVLDVVERVAEHQFHHPSNHEWQRQPKQQKINKACQSLIACKFNLGITILLR